MHRLRFSATIALIVGHIGSATALGSSSAAGIQPVAANSATTPMDDAFAGAWASCDGAATPDECSRYLLVQRGERICGTWSYVASGQSFDGRVIAHAISGTVARRTHVCGRPGSETQTECTDGWQRVDAPLQRCDGKLSDVSAAEGACIAHYEAVPASHSSLAALQAQPWLKACLAADP
ncbi:MAG: hypothetical protein RR704_17630 [Stenotrophomonas sp.]